ncbi:MAG TPA: type II secretion system protein [Thermoanaerobaculia bacterium]|nr:type II secretion system protein [Thermoanaerobaculia bacterium]
MRQRGFTLVEVMVALMILGLVITTSLAVFVERTKRQKEATETILAYQALANEAEVRRRMNFTDLDTAPPTFVTDTGILIPLMPFKTHITIDQPSTDVKNLTMQVIWQKGKRVATLHLSRVNTGGSNLW